MKTVPVWRINVSSELSNEYKGFILLACENPSDALDMYGYYICKDVRSMDEISNRNKHLMSLDIFNFIKTCFETKIGKWKNFIVISDCVNEI